MKISEDNNLTIYQGDALAVLASLPDESVQCCVTSPPYWGLRDYGVAGQLGLEKTPEEFVAKLTAIFEEVRRVLKDDGVIWVNLGDSYAGSGKGGGGSFMEERRDGSWKVQAGKKGWKSPPPGLKPKDLVGIPWMVAFALRAKGWYLRSDIIWHKPNDMPESCQDRPTKSHEYIFLLSKSAQYFYDAESIREAPSEAMLKQICEGYDGESTKLFELAGAQDASGTKSRIIDGKRRKLGWKTPDGWDISKWEGGHGSFHKNGRERGHKLEQDGFTKKWDQMTKLEQQACGSNKRTVWSVATAPYRDSHFATFPPDLIKPCILAGSRPADVILDPFAGSGTTGAVALEFGRKALLIELNPDYIKLIQDRCRITPGLQLT